MLKKDLGFDWQLFTKIVFLFFRIKKNIFNYKKIENKIFSKNIF